MRHSHLFSRSVMTAAILSAITSTAAVAQEVLLEEVVVTAQKREQSQQDVPVAVTALDGQVLEDNGIRDVFDIQAIAPGLRVDQSQSATASNFAIRGVYTSSQNFGLESSVGLYVDDVYRARQSSMINNLVDIQSVQVLRGPQGTLFGRNTPNGAVLINTRAPDFNGEGFVEVSAGNMNLFSLSGAKSFTAIDDVLAFRVTGFATKRDGFVDDVKLGDDLINDRDRWGVRAQALYTPTDQLSVRVVVDHSEVDEICCGAPVYKNNDSGDMTPDRPNSSGGVDSRAGAMTSDALMASLGGTVLRGENFYDDKVALSFAPISQNEDQGLSVHVDYDLSDELTLTSISAYRAFDSYDKLDADYSDLDALENENEAEQSSFSQELRLNYLDDQKSIIGGVFYFTQELDNTSGFFTGEHTAALGGVYALGAPLPAAFFPADGAAFNEVSQSHESWAVFSQMDWFLRDDLTLTVGARYTWEDKEIKAIFTEENAGPGFAFFPPLASRSNLNQSLDDGKLTGTLKLSWFAGEDTMFYASYGTGYKAGGTNTDRILEAFDVVFDAENAESYEVGMKAEFPEQAVRLNVALHKTEVDDLQTIAFQGNGFLLANAGVADTYGAEVELLWQAAEKTRVMASYAYSHAEFEDFPGGSCWVATPYHTGNEDPGTDLERLNTTGVQVCDRSGGRIAGNPDHSLVLNVRQGFMLSSDMEAFVLGEYVYTDETMTDTNNDPLKAQDAYHLVNLRAGIDFYNWDAQLTLWGRNVFDEDYLATVFDVPIQLGRLNAYSREPATFGVTLRKNF